MQYVMPTVGKREAKKADKLGRLEQASLDLFLEQGYANTSVEDIVARADIARGTFYLYFKSKEALFQHLVDAPLRRVLDALGASREGLRNASTPEESRAASRAVEQVLGSLVLEHPRVALLYFREQRNYGTVGDWMRDIAQVSDALAADIVTVAMKRGLIRAVNPIVAARAVAGALERVCFDILRGETSMGAPLDAGLAAFDLFLHGFSEHSAVVVDR